MPFTERFLNAKHWQLFTLMIGLPIIVQFGSMIAMFASAVNATNEPPLFVMPAYIILIIVVSILSGATTFGWVWSIGSGLQEKIPNGITMKFKKFKTFYLIAMGYMLLIVLSLLIFIPISMQPDFVPSAAITGILLLLFIPLHFLAIFGIFYGLYFAAKTLKTIELNKEVEFSEFIGEFLMLWFSFIGVWIIQPKINKLVNQEPEEEGVHV
ncbi:hypothetical protein [Roseivirga pacifica]|uniref:hypothetical protein n=1 Tax=Roseivirga pacifica TaxID=1267423 RepID=UPI00227A9E54|nr:hypothetical protein [Roseivirga pacifica]